jgi:thymidylate synthase (FAD)
MARSVLPVSIYTEFYWKIDLHNLLRFISLRSDKHAQLEIREYSDVIKKIVTEYCPVTMEAFDEYFTESLKFSKTELIALKTGNIDIIESKSGTDSFKDKLKLIREWQI